MPSILGLAWGLSSISRDTCCSIVGLCVSSSSPFRKRQRASKSSSSDRISSRQVASFQPFQTAEL